MRTLCRTLRRKKGSGGSPFDQMIPPSTNDPELATWLASLAPRLELTLRLALRGIDSRCRADRIFAARLDELFNLLLPTDNELITLLAEASEWREKIIRSRCPINLVGLRGILSTEKDRS